MATELLWAKGDMEDLGVYWSDAFLLRHLELKLLFVARLDKERALAENPEVITAWFKLFFDTIAKHNIYIDDVYNIDEKRFLMGVIKNVKVIVSRHKKKSYYITQDGSREWITLIECISTNGRVLDLYFIFKGKQQQKAWFIAL
jgi:hypothetical protein